MYLFFSADTFYTKYWHLKIKLKIDIDLTTAIRSIEIWTTDASFSVIGDDTRTVIFTRI